MENHPIPQDVTGFQFKLIGNMTLKQFGYVGVGVVLAVIFFYAPLPGLIKLLFVPFFAISGLALAFVPVEGRPMDDMAKYFLMALIKPNQYIYHKTGGMLSFSELDLQPVVTPKPTQTTQVTNTTQKSSKAKEERLASYLYDTIDAPVNPLDQRESQMLSALFAQPLPQTSAQPVIPAAPVQPVNIPPQPQAVQYAMPQQSVQPIAEPVQPVITQQQAPVQNQVPPIPPQQPIAVESAPYPVPQAQPQVINAAPVSQPAPTFVQVTPTTANQPPTTANHSSFEFPNLITGTVKDSRGNALAGILVDVKSAEGDSVRAFKTNALGQFASATQLPNGMYTVVFEDPKGQHKFDTFQINVNGTVLQPIAVVSIDAREELRRSLFG